MKNKIRFCIAYTLQTLDILLDYGMLPSHFHMKLMVCRHQPPALEKRHFSGSGVPRNMSCRVRFQREALSADSH